MRYLSVCSGIEAASVAWHQLGWEPVGFAEIEKFPAQVLAHRFPGVKNYGDMTKYKEWDIEPGTIDLLVGGTPCQAFSVAGLRKGLADPRGNLALVFLGLADHFKPEWIVWENVPGVLSSNGGRDFGAFLGALGELGYGWAYRILDAQYYGVAQRRRRLFLVGHASGDPRRCAEVLFEPESLRGDPAPSREAGQKTTADPRASASGGGLWDTVGALCADTHPGAYSGQDAYTGRIIPSLYESHPNDSRVTGTGGNNTPLVTDGEASAFTYSGYSNQPAWMTGNRTDCLSASGHSDGSHQGIGIVQSGEASAFSWQTAGDMRGMVPRPTAQLQRCQIEAVMVPDTITARESGQGYWMEDTVAGTLRAEGEDRPSRPSHMIAQSNPVMVPEQSGYETVPALTASGRGVERTGESRGQDPVVAVNQDAVQVQWASGGGQVENPTAQALRSNAEHNYQFVRQWDASSVVAPSLTASNDPSRSPQSSEITQQVSAVVQATHPTMHVRRLTPVECERLQGFPDGWTDIRPGGKDTPDSPRYKALGNSMAVPVMRWIGMRIAEHTSADANHFVDGNKLVVVARKESSRG